MSAAETFYDRKIYADGNTRIQADSISWSAGVAIEPGQQDQEVTLLASVPLTADKPVSAAIERIDQCVASTGVLRNVRSITAAT
jgi:hypothetical protein